MDKDIPLRPEQLWDFEKKDFAKPEYRATYETARRILREKLRPLYEAARDSERGVDRAIVINCRP